MKKQTILSTFAHVMPTSETFNNQFKIIKAENAGDKLLVDMETCSVTTNDSKLLNEIKTNPKKMFWVSYPVFNVLKAQGVKNICMSDPVKSVKEDMGKFVKTTHGGLIFA